MQNATQNSAVEPNKNFRLFWIRECEPSHVAYDCGLEVPAPDLALALAGAHPGQRHMSRPTGRRPRPDPLTLDPARMHDVAGRIRALAAGAGESVELHLPFIGRREWNVRESILRRCDFTTRHGRILPASVLEWRAEPVYMGRLIGATAADRSAHADLRYTVKRNTWGPFAPIALPVPGSAPDLPGHAEAQIGLSLSAEACRAWISAPAESDPCYYDIYCEVSRRVQSVMRRWSFFWWLTDLEPLDDVARAHTMLSYRSGSTYLGSRRLEFTYDTLSTDWFQPFLRRARRPLAELLRPIRAELLRIGNPRLAGRYFPAHRKLILESARHEQRLLHALVSAEGSVMNEFAAFGLAMRGASPRDGVRAGARLAKRLAPHLRFFVRCHDFLPALPVLLFEATDALNVALGGEPSLRYTTQIRPREAGFHHAAGL